MNVATSPPTATTLASEPAPAAKTASPAIPQLFRAMLFKEWHELAPWALGAFVLFAGFLAYVLYQVPAESRWYSMSIPQHMALSSLFCPLIAAIFGFMQFFSETGSDRMALLMHRPLPRAWLFFGKAAVGLVLYFLLTGVPLFAAVWWLSEPLNAPFPFLGLMTMPFVADVLTGIPAYLAGMLIGFRIDGRWRFSYLLPPLVPVACGLVCALAPNLSFALVVISITTALLLTAAWGLFVSSRHDYRQPRPAKIATGIYQYLALCMAVALILLMAQWGYRYWTAYQRDRTIVVRRILPDGRPAIAIQADDRTETHYVYTSNLQLELAHVPPAEWSTTAWMYDQTKYIDRTPWLHGASRTHVGLYSQRALPLGWFLPKTHDFLVAYDLRLKLLLGALGPGGFSAGAHEPPTRFSHPIILMTYIVWPGEAKSYGELCVGAGDSLWLLNGADQPDATSTFHRIFSTPNHERILGVRMIRQGKEFWGPPNGIDAFVLLTESTIYFLSLERNPRVLVSYSNPALNMSNILVDYIPSTAEFVIESPRGPRSQPSAEVEDLLVYIKQDGTSRVVTLPPSPIKSRATETPVEERVVLAAALPPPLSVLHAIYSVRTEARFESRFGITRREEAATMELGITTFVSGVCALLAWLYGRRGLLSMRALIAWTMGTFLMGPPGLILLLLTRRMPLRVPCPTCRKKRPAAIYHCPHCNAEFSPPAHNGTEIFTQGPATIPTGAS